MALAVLIRGLNVGGHRRLRPSQLARELGHLEAVNIGSTGALAIHKRTSHAAVRSEVAGRLPFPAEVFVCAGREILALIARDPFAGIPPRSDVVRFVSVLDRRLRRKPALPFELPGGGVRWVVKVLGCEGRFAFGLHRREMKAIGCLGELDRVLGARVTTRSWSTIVAIANALEERR